MSTEDRCVDLVNLTLLDIGLKRLFYGSQNGGDGNAITGNAQRPFASVVKYFASSNVKPVLLSTMNGPPS